MGFRNCFVVLFSALVIVSCSDSTSPELKSENGFYQIQITELAGSRVWKNLLGEKDTVDNFLPLPANMGEFSVAPIDSLNDREFIKAIVLNNGSTLGEVMEVHPVAVMKLLDGEKSIPFLLLIPKDKEKRLLDIQNLFELQKHCYSCKNLMEEWVTNLPSHEKLVFFGWEDHDQAERLLDEYARLAKSAEK